MTNVELVSLSLIIWSIFPTAEEEKDIVIGNRLSLSWSHSNVPFSALFLIPITTVTRNRNEPQMDFCPEIIIMGCWSVVKGGGRASNNSANGIPSTQLSWSFPCRWRFVNLIRYSGNNLIQIIFFHSSHPLSCLDRVLALRLLLLLLCRRLPEMSNLRTVHSKWLVHLR